jgi:light-regulated signal transduction histidine kinase (bacteriophytochrome)
MSIAEKNSEIICGDLPVVLADPIAMIQLFQNLIGNALKFQRNEKPVVHVVCEPRRGSDWLFSIRDNGIGIDPVNFERLFQVFQRLHTKQEYPGTGIGLAICKKIVEHHGGQIWLESEPGKGTVFFFTIPKKEA